MIKLQKIFSSSKTLFFISLLVIIIAGGVIIWKTGILNNISVSQLLPGEVASIGKSKVTKADISYQIQLDKCYGIGSESKSTALIKIINSLLEKEALESAFNIKVKTKDLEDKSNWVDINTKAKNILECVKKVFANDKKSYLSLYISPTVINPTLYNNFYFSPLINKEEINKISEIKAKIDKGQKMKDFPEYKTFNIPKEIVLPDLLKKYKGQFKKPVLSEIVTKMKPGEIWPQIIEDKYSYSVVRLLKEDKDKYYLDGIVVEKKKFTPWFRDMIKKNIKISIYNSKLAQDLRTNYSQVWWVPLIKD